MEYHPFLVVALAPVPITLSSSALGFLSEYKILVASALLSPFLKVLIIMSLSVSNPTLLTVSQNLLTYSLAVLFP